MYHRSRKIVVVILTVFLVWGCMSEGPIYDEYSFNGSTMGTTYHISLVGGNINLETRSQMGMQVDSLLKVYNHILSTYEPHSEISEFNKLATLEPVVKMGLKLCVETDGAFDITVMPIVNFFGFGFEPGENRFPTVSELDAWLDLTGCHQLVAGDSTLSKGDPRVSIDLSAIAKGDAADIVADFLATMGYENIFVEIGGEIVTRGVNKFGKAWQIGIDRPNFSGAPGADLQHIIQLSNMAVASSGDYRNFRKVEGKRVSHMIDPRTGSPISHQLAAVTVISETCLLADGLATSVMILGQDAGLDWLEHYPGVEGLLIVRNEDGSFTEFMTSGFKQYLLD